MQDVSALLHKLSALTERLASVRTIEGLAEVIRDVVAETVEVERSGLFLIDPDSQQLRLVWAEGMSADERIEAERTALDRHPGWVIRNAQVLDIPDVLADPERRSSDGPKHRFSARSRLFLPILGGGRCVGTVGLASVVPHHFAARDLSILKYAAATTGVMYENLLDRRAIERQLRTIEGQKRDLIALSSPVVEVWEGILVLPVIGQVDEARAGEMTARLLPAVVARRAETVILDLTGMDLIDAPSAERLIQMSQAVALLGCRCVLTGMSTTVAMTMANLGLATAHVETFASVRQALHRFLGRPAQRLG